MIVNVSRFITLLCVLAVGATAMAQQACDTIAVLRDVRSVVLTSSGGKSSEIIVEVDADGQVPEYTYRYNTDVSEPGDISCERDSITLDFSFLRTDRRSGGSKFYSVWGRDIHAGAFVPVAADAALRTGWELGMGKIAAAGFRPWSGGPSFELGIGLVYRNLRLDDGLLFGSDDRGVLYIEPVPDGYGKASSRLDVWAFELPFCIRQNLCSGFYIDLGVSMVMNISAKATRNYRNADGTVKYSHTLSHLHQRNIGMELKFAVGLDSCLGAYVRYSPVSLFRSGFGSQTDYLSAGATIAF